MDLTLPEQSFDVIFEKGLLDSVLTSETGFEDCHKVLNAVSKLLKHPGVFISVSHSESREPYLSNKKRRLTKQFANLPEAKADTEQDHVDQNSYGWKIDCIPITPSDGTDEAPVCYAYIMKLEQKQKIWQKNQPFYGSYDTDEI